MIPSVLQMPFPQPKDWGQIEEIYYLDCADWTFFFPSLQPRLWRMSLIHQTPLPNWFNVLLNWGPSNYKRASCDSLEKDKKVQKMFFAKFCFELELCPMTHYYSKWREHREAINLQSAELFELPRRLMPTSENNGISTKI